MYRKRDAWFYFEFNNFQIIKIYVLWYGDSQMVVRDTDIKIALITFEIPITKHCTERLSIPT